MTHPRRLLILDDDPLSGQTIGNVASLAGYEVEVTDRHPDFFRLLEQWEPGIIALDLVMPGMDGVEIIAELARRHSQAKIIITSGVGGRVLDAAGRTAMERGLHIVGVLPKPFSPAALREMLAKSTPGADETAAGTSGRREHAADRKITAHELEQALAEHQLYVVYQPKVSCKTGMLSGFEALVRWKHPARGTVAPDEFVPLAESCGLVDALTTEVMGQAMQWYRDFRARVQQLGSAHHGFPDPDKLTLSLNISARSLSNTQLFERLTLLCGEYAIHPNNLILELTETSAMEDPVSSLELLTRLRLRGFRLSIDDFGTGYSSMVQLVKLPFSEIKVDKSFVITARESEESRVVIKSIVSLGMSLGLIVTAEGIEDEETQVFLRNIGCTLAQGYLFARPLPGDQVLPWLMSRGMDSEQRRLQALTTLGLMDTPAESRFDMLIHVARSLFNAPMATFALIDADRIWFKARAGVDTQSVLRASAFCNHAIEHNRVYVVNDALAHTEFARHKLVVSPPHIRFYAGAPVHTADGSVVGTVNLLDTEARSFSVQQVHVLQELARMIEDELYWGTEDCRDQITGLFNHQTTERRVPQILELCFQLALPCTLHLFELDNLGAGGDASKRNSHLLGTFAGFLDECYETADFIGRFDRHQFVMLMIGRDDKSEKMARWKLESSVRVHNQGAIPGMDIQYRVGQAHTQANSRYHFQSLVDLADAALPPL